MEKDYFKDRPKECTLKEKLIIGNMAYICLKKDQPTAKNINDLTLITINAHLTSVSEHPRGIKLKGYNYKTNENGFILLDNDNLPIITDCVGRCTYLVNDDGSLLTNEGPKFIVKNNNKYSLAKAVDLDGLYKIRAVFKIKNSNILIEFDTDKYSYFKTIEEAGASVEKFTFDNARIENEYITGTLNKDNVMVKDYDVVYNDKYLDIPKKDFCAYLKGTIKEKKIEIELQSYIVQQFSTKQ